MPLWLLPLLKNKWTWRIAAGLALMAALLWARHHFIEQGKQQGQEEQKQVVASDLEKMRSADRDQTAAILAGFQKQLDDAKQKAVAADARSDAAFEALATIAQQRESGGRAVATLSDPELHGYTKRALGAQDLAGAYSAAEERKIAEAVTQLPLAEKEIAGLKEQSAAKDDQLAASQQQVAAQAGQLAAQAGYTKRLEGYFVELYNLHPPEYRSWKCLWIKKCGKRKLPVPALDDLKKGN